MNHQKKVFLRKTVVWIRYLMPFICMCTMILMCALPLYRLANDDTERISQSVFELADTTIKSSKATLSKSGMSQVDYGLAKTLRRGVIVFRVVLVLDIFLSLWFSFTVLAALLNHPESNAANRWKVKFKLFIPGKWTELILPWLNLIPLCLPYYVIQRFSKYYIVSGITDTTAKYYDYAVYTDGLNPIWLIFGLAFLSTVIFIIVREWTGMYQMDMYRYYLPQPKNIKK